MTASQPYDLREYAAADLPAVARLQRHLLGEDIEHNRAYLAWKYHENPQGDRPWAIVADHPTDGIVGFRGFVPSLWRCGDADVALLALADTCVDTGHRRRGLFTGMTREALSRFADSGYRAIINLSTSARPAPGYIKMGWHVFGHHGQLTRLTLGGIWRRIRGRGDARGDRAPQARRDGFACAVARTPRPGEMAAVTQAAAGGGGRFVLRRDEAFYGWRYGNVRERYVFAFAQRDEEMVAFVVVRHESAPGGGAIVDYAETAPGGINTLVGLLLDQGGYGTLSVWDARPGSADGGDWRRRGFLALDGVKRFAGRRREPMPLLVRPLVVDPAESDWRVAGRDLRDPETWNIMEICSDGS